MGSRLWLWALLSLLLACGDPSVRPTAVCTTPADKRLVVECVEAATPDGDEDEEQRWIIRECAETMCDPAFYWRSPEGAALTVAKPCTKASTPEERFACSIGRAEEVEDGD